MEWIEHIERVGDQLKASYVDEHRSRRVASLSQLPKAMRLKVGQVASVKSAALDSMRLVDGREWLEAFKLSHLSSANHQVFELISGNRRILVPAGVVIQSIVGQLGGLGDILLQPTGLDRMGVPLVRNGTLDFGFSKLILLSRSSDTRGIRSRFAWLSSYPGARRMWHSIQEFGSQGTLGILLAPALADISFHGKLYRGTAMAVRMAISTLTPKETAFPFAAKFSPNSFTFDHRSAAARTQMKALELSGRRSGRTAHRQASLLKGPEGFSMSSAEWEIVQYRLNEAGVKKVAVARNSLDCALEKFGAGTAWLDFGRQGRAASKFAITWERAGKWKIFTDILREVRSQPLGS
ncbi:hypothetical protein [Roseateles noduli]|uniref:hypothetical protein n=1 Tax=Roseateles noduli TaxID=2052484 RepID=UPI003D648CD4